MSKYNIRSGVKGITLPVSREFRQISKTLNITELFSNIHTRYTKWSKRVHIAGVEKFKAATEGPEHNGLIFTNNLHIHELGSK